MAEFKIVMQGHGTGKIFRDGIELDGVQSFSVNCEAGKQNFLSITYIAEKIDIEIDADG